MRPGLTAWHWQYRRPRSAKASFAADEAGLAAFGDYLQGCRSSLFYLLADVAEEGFQVEDVPFVHGRDRRSLIQRKLAQFFYGTPLSTGDFPRPQQRGAPRRTNPVLRPDRLFAVRTLAAGHAPGRMRS